MYKIKPAFHQFLTNRATWIEGESSAVVVLGSKTAWNAVTVKTEREEKIVIMMDHLWELKSLEPG